MSGGNLFAGHEPEATVTAPSHGEGAVRVIGGDQLDACARQFVNRWVFLPHHRDIALRELKDLLRDARTEGRNR